jgi:prepilin-type N-terminal cleavage/methylation domain-containing protein
MTNSSRGFSLFELLVAMAIVTVMAGMAVPFIQESALRNTVWTATEMIGVQVRQARLRAISRNMSFRLVFDCPTARQIRVLEVTGNPLIDNAADRCTQYRTHDSGIYQMPSDVTYTAALPPLEVNSRGMYSAIGGAVPLVINVGYGGRTFRSMTVSATGQITFATY